MSDYPGRTRPPSSEAGTAKCETGRAIKCAEKQCGRNGMPLMTDPIGPDAKPGKKPMADESK